jgi:hypothetical protein
MLVAMIESPQLKASSAQSDISAWMAQDKREASETVLPTELLNEFVAVGNAADCSAVVASLLEAGADRVILVPNPAGYRSTAAMVEQMRAAASLLGGPHPNP